jgi:hypothetical protein
VVEVASATAGVCCNGRQLAEGIQLNATVGAAEDYPSGSFCRLRRFGIRLRLLRAGRRPESDCHPATPPPHGQTRQTENKLKFEIKKLWPKQKLKEKRRNINIKN